MKLIYLVDSSGKSPDQIVFYLDESLLQIYDVYNDLERQNVYFVVNSSVYVHILHWALSKGFFSDNIVLDNNVEQLQSVLTLGSISKHVVVLSSQIRLGDSKRFLWLVESSDSPILSLLPRTDENQDLDVIPLFVATAVAGTDAHKLSTSITTALIAFKDKLTTDHEDLFEKVVEHLQSVCALSGKCKMADEVKVATWTTRHTQALIKTAQASVAATLRKVDGRCHARIGLMGNPSDGFGGKTISFLIENFTATVTIAEVPSGLPSMDSLASSSTGAAGESFWTPKSIHIEPHPVHDKAVFRGVDDLFAHSSIQGYYGGVRLLQAAFKMFAQRCSAVSTIAHTWRSRQHKSIRISYETDIPRMVRLIPLPYFVVHN